MSDESTEWNLPSTSAMWRSADHAVGHRLHDALLDRRDELRRDRAADDLGLEHEPLAVAGGGELDVTDRVLAVPAGLLHVPAVALGRPSDRLAIRDLRGLVHDVDAELLLEPVHLDVQVRLAHPVDHGLVGLLDPIHAERRVLLTQPGEPGGELVLFTLG
jgi:hypothetical protein